MEFNEGKLDDLSYQLDKSSMIEIEQRDWVLRGKHTEIVEKGSHGIKRWGAGGLVFSAGQLVFSADNSPALKIEG